MDDPKGLRLIFRALYHRNYRLFFGGQGISLIGTWMQQIAMSWLVYRMTNSAFLLGLIGFSSQICSFFFSPFPGVLSDRWNRHRILVATQSLAMVQAFILATLTLTGTIAVHHLIILSLFLGFVNAFDMPTRQAFVVEMVEKREDLGNATPLNSFLFNGARLVGPSIAGVLISILGEGMCFLLNGFSFLAVIIAIASGIFGIRLISFSLFPVLWLSFFLLLLTGFGMMVHMASCHPILQTMVGDDKRGRVMSLYAMALMGMAPFGSLAGGSLAGKIGAPSTLIIGGASCLLGSFLFIKILPSLREIGRPIYTKKGILSEKSEKKRIIFSPQS